MSEQEQHGSKHVPDDKKVLAGILALLFGGIGVHKFYLEKTTQGIVFLLFFWTGIPALIGFIEGILILADNRQLF